MSHPLICCDDSRWCSLSRPLYIMCRLPYISCFFFFFNDTATTEIYTLSLHDALPIFPASPPWSRCSAWSRRCSCREDRKSTRLNSSHTVISYAVFCLKKKKRVRAEDIINQKSTITRDQACVGLL